MPSLGLSTLFAAMEATEEAKKENDELLEAMEDVIDDDIRVMITDDEGLALPDDDEEIEIARQGLGMDADDEAKIRDLVDKIPEDDEDMDEDIEALTEALMIDLD